MRMDLHNMSKVPQFQFGLVRRCGPMTLIRIHPLFRYEYILYRTSNKKLMSHNVYACQLLIVLAEPRYTSCFQGNSATSKNWASRPVVEIIPVWQVTVGGAWVHKAPPLTVSTSHAALKAPGKPAAKLENLNGPVDFSLEWRFTSYEKKRGPTHCLNQFRPTRILVIWISLYIYQYLCEFEMNYSLIPWSINFTSRNDCIGGCMVARGLASCCQLPEIKLWVQSPVSPKHTHREESRTNILKLKSKSMWNLTSDLISQELLGHFCCLW